MKKIVQAIKTGNYSVSYSTPNNVREGEHPWGGKWLYVEDVDTPRNGSYIGGCTVTVLVEDDEFEFEYHFESETWDGCEITDEITEALNNSDIILLGGDCPSDTALEVYAYVEGIDLGDYEIYYCGLEKNAPYIIDACYKSLQNKNFKIVNDEEGMTVLCNTPYGVYNLTNENGTWLLDESDDLPEELVELLNSTID